VTTGNVTQLTDNTAADYTPIFSPDGSKLAFTSNRGGSPAIYSMNLNGSIPVGAETKLVDGQDAAFNEDGSKITFQSYINGNAEIYIVGVDGSNLSRLTNNPASDSNPVWGRLIPSPP
jgi:Tol biopolymer transport system component